MVGVSLAAAILIAMPLGVLAFLRPALGRVVLAIVDVLQTLPALALLVFLIPWLGIGYAPAIVALLIYSVLPILRNTMQGSQTFRASCSESALALGLSRVDSVAACRLAARGKVHHRRHTHRGRHQRRHRDARRADRRGRLRSADPCRHPPR